MKNKQFEDNAEYISKQLSHHIYYLKRKERHELRQIGSLHQHSSGPSRMFNQKKNRFGTHPERFAPNDMPEGENTSTLNQKRAWLKATYMLVDIDWNRVNRYYIILIII
ncbi:unnamed protein product [Macrosiphum euphorbiae]|uniref:Uncharacterized protein n=1 Tax=Macrosiphum euphorbiae TaxID=13131 RepID=A0AAV0Y3K6_9HEMI|nr:unnamed protein product [Macrosiphum euphorbiae]